jgi:hypothetical protein
MRPALLAVVAVAAAGCGSAQPPHAAAPPPEKPSARNGPPGAWLETAAGTTWLARGSFCWHVKNGNLCADSAAPSCDQKWIPQVEVARGETVRAHLGFEPEQASVEGATTSVNGRTVSWQATRGGAFMLFTKTRDGDASYFGCAVLTRKPSAYSGPA